MFCPFQGRDPIATSGSTARESVSSWDLDNVGGVDVRLFILHHRSCWCSAGLLSSKDLRSVFSPDPQEPHLSQPKLHSGEMPPTFQRSEPQEGPGKGNDPRASHLEGLSSPAILGICPSENGNTDKEQNIWYRIQAQDQRKLCSMSWRTFLGWGAGNLDPILGPVLCGWPWVC